VKTKVSPAIVGAFVIGAFALGTLALLSFGGISFFAKPERFVVYFDESIHGLDLGSAVKLRGVRVGRVTSLNLRYDAAKKPVVAVTCELSRDIVTDAQGSVIDIGSRASLEQMIKRGLSAQLGVAGLATGLLFVELDFKDPADLPPTPPSASDKLLVVPSVPSAISEFQKSLGEILGNVRDIDFAGLAKDLSALVATTRKQVEGVDLRGFAEQWKTTGARWEALAASPEIPKTFANLNAAIADLRATVAKLDGQIEPAGKELQATLVEARRTVETFNETAGVARTFLKANAHLGSDLGDTLERLNETAEAVTRLAEFLERNPNALLTGRRRPQ